jgi:hypothetical protein
MWTDHLVNKEPITGCFPDVVPPLEGMHLRKLCVEPMACSSITILLEWFQMPTGAPNKWIEKGYKSLQLVLSASFDGQLVLEGAFGEGRVNVDISKQGVIIRQGASASLSFVPLHIDARLVPIQGDFSHEGVQL